VGVVLAEIDRILELWDRPFIEFADDNAIVDHEWWKALARELVQRPLRWFVETDVSVANDPSLLALLRRAGCAEVLLGLESPRRSDLRGLELVSDWKHRHWPAYADAVRTIQSNGIAVNACFIIGIDGQGPEIFEAIEEFVEATTPYDVQITILTPFPGTPLRQRLEAAGRLRGERRWERCTLFDLEFEPVGMSAVELEQGFERLARTLYAEEATRRRRRGFRRQWRDRVSA
jgi:radical SAM superfamily enzyme YgiQ (UPF0313 family)